MQDAIKAKAKAQVTQKVTKSILQSRKRPQYCSQYLKSGRVWKQQAFSLNCKWCTKHRNECVKVCLMICITFSLADIIKCQSICGRRWTILPHKSSVSGAVETEKMTRLPFALGKSFVEKLRLECKRKKNVPWRETPAGDGGDATFIALHCPRAVSCCEFFSCFGPLSHVDYF